MFLHSLCLCWFIDFSSLRKILAEFQGGIEVNLWMLSAMFNQKSEGGIQPHLKRKPSLQVNRSRLHNKGNYFVLFTFISLCPWLKFKMSWIHIYFSCCYDHICHHYAPLFSLRNASLLRNTCFVLWTIHILDLASCRPEIVTNSCGIRAEALTLVFSVLQLCSYPTLCGNEDHLGYGVWKLTEEYKV